VFPRIHMIVRFINASVKMPKMPFPDTGRAATLKEGH